MKKLNIFLDYFLNLIFYIVILSIMAYLFKKSIYVDKSFYGIWFLITSVIIFVLNKTIKPLITFITLPLTGITLGLFYPFINVIILKLADVILFGHFDTGNVFMLLLIAILIGGFTFTMEHFFIYPILERND